METTPQSAVQTSERSGPGKGQRSDATQTGSLAVSGTSAVAGGLRERPKGKLPLNRRSKRTSGAGLIRAGVAIRRRLPGVGKQVPLVTVRNPETGEEHQIPRLQVNIPFKKPKEEELTDEQKAFNRLLQAVRVRADGALHRPGQELGYPCYPLPLCALDLHPDRAGGLQAGQLAN